MSEWQEGTLTDIAEFVMGQSPYGETCNDAGAGVPLLNGPTEFGIRNPKAIQFTTDPKRFCKSGDILFCVRGSTTGKMNWSDQEYAIGRGLAALRHRNGGEYKYFLKAVIDFNLELLLASATGSTFPNVSKDQIANLEVLIPPLEEQKVIASILSNLDNKIDLLHRQNNTLERMAETLFKQRFVEEALEDWEEVTLSSLCTLITKGTTPTTLGHSFVDEGINFIKAESITDTGGFIREKFAKISAETHIFLKRSIIQKSDVLCSIAGTIGRVTIVEESILPANTNQAIAILRVDESKCFPEFIYLFLKSDYFQEVMDGKIVHAVQPNLSLGEIGKTTLKIAPFEKLIEFRESVKSIFDKKTNNLLQIQTLEKLRDNLLPKLMSGEVRVTYDA